MQEPNAHFWKDQGTYHGLLFIGDLPGHMSLEFRAPSWRSLKRLMREHGYETNLRDKDVKDQWRMSGGDMFLSTA